MKTWQTLMIIFLCVGALVSNAQTTFSKAYDLNYGNELGAAVYIVNDGYLLFGTGPADISGSNYVTKMLKVDLDGNVLWTKTYGGQGTTRSINYGAGGVTCDLNKYFYVTGVFADTIEPEDILVTKVNFNGDTIWSKVYGGPKQEVPYSIFYDTSNHYIYVTGATESFGPGITNAFVWILDTIGNTVETWFYSGGDYDYGKSILKLSDTIYLSGYTTSYGNKSEPFLMKLDTLGNTANLSFYGTSGWDIEAGIAKSNNNDKLLMWGWLDSLQGAAFVSRLDLSGAVDWRKVIKWYGVITEAKFLEDNSIIIIGASNESRSKGNIAKLDSLGNVLWYREYSFNDPNVSGIFAYCIFYSFDWNLLTGDIIAFGHTDRDPALGDSTGQDFWLVKLDSMGCLVPGCDTLTGVGIEPVAIDDIQVTVYPNPASGAARVIVNHGTPNVEVGFTLYDLAGKLVTDSEHQLNGYGFGEWLVHLEALPQGVYIYRIAAPNGQVQTGKLVVE